MKNLHGESQLKTRGVLQFSFRRKQHRLSKVINQKRFIRMQLNAHQVKQNRRSKFGALTIWSLFRALIHLGNMALTKYLSASWAKSFYFQAMVTA